VRKAKRVLKSLKARAWKPKKKAANSPVRLVVGLRNPGPDYEATRHNVGAEVVERAVAHAGESFKRGPSRISGLLAQSGVGEDRTLYLLPYTFMNESGAPVRAALDYYGLGVADMIVVHDDIDLPFGRLRLQVGGGRGGHNGVRSLERVLGTKDFSRLKCGVGRPPGSQDPAEFVLRTFSKAERSEVDVMVADAAQVIARWLDDRDRAQEIAALRGREDD
jgi:PTH1 family peptidyl-tRNA hydrolase